MFDNYVFIKDSCKNVVEEGNITGFELQTLITYYRGIPLSMVYEVGVRVDSLPVPKEKITISLDQTEWFPITEAETVTDYKWVNNEGGLRRGEHDVTLNVSVWPAYYPMPAGGERTRKVII